MDANQARRTLSDDIGRVAGGDDDAMRRVYDRTKRKLFATCRNIVGDPEQAEDVVQDAYLRIWKYAGAFDQSRSSPITWMCAIARNAAIDSRRSAARWTSDAIGDVSDPADPGPPIDLALERAEDGRRALACLDRLGGDQARSIRAAFLGGQSYLEVARAHDVPLGTAKSWIRRGLRQLRVAMADER